MTGIRAIETCYGFHNFRSRIEARWAVFLDALGLSWEYERQGYELPSGRYLPDFWVSLPYDGRDDGVWIEVKGETPTRDEIIRAGELAVATDHWVLIFSGDIRSNATGRSTPLVFSRTRSGEKSDFWIDYHCRWRQCLKCQRLHPIESFCHRCDVVLSHESKGLMTAFQRAASARFEYGESG